MVLGLDIVSVFGGYLGWDCWVVIVLMGSVRLG